MTPRHLGTHLVRRHSRELFSDKGSDAGSQEFDLSAILVAYD